MDISLKNQVLLEDLQDSELDKITAIAQVLEFRKGDTIFREKENTKGLYLIKSGKVEISKLTQDGWRQTLAALSDGQFFGELSILENRQHEAAAVASETTVIILLTKEGFEKLEKDDAAIAFKIIKRIALVMCKNLRRMNDKFLNALINY